jgi:iron complex outermembrane receptor protein
MTVRNTYHLFLPLHTHSELRAEFDKGIKHFSSIYVFIAMEYYAKQNRVYLADNTETPTQGYTLFDAGMGGDITREKRKNNLQSAFCSQQYI